MKKLLLGGSLAILLLWTTLTACTLVQPGERAVVRRFGRVLPDQPGPGLYIGLPWGIDRVDRVPVARIKRVVVGMTAKVEENTEVSPPGQLLTGDHNLVNMQVEVYYTVFEDQVADYVLMAD